jgi:hypothetical protein
MQPVARKHVMYMTLCMSRMVIFSFVRRMVAFFYYTYCTYVFITILYNKNVRTV